MFTNATQAFLYNKLLNQQGEMGKTDMCDFPQYMWQFSKLNISQK